MKTQTIAPSSQSDMWLKRVLKQYSVGRSLIRYGQVLNPASHRPPVTGSLKSARLFSYPGSGRTWLELLIKKAVSLHYGVPTDNPLDDGEWLKKIPEESRFFTSHEDRPNRKTPEELQVSKRQYEPLRVVLLVRDPRDVVVSQYFKQVKRRRTYDGDISSFIHLERGSLQTVIRYYLIWHENRRIPSAFKVVRYEDLLEQTEMQLKGILEFLGLKATSSAMLNEVVDYCSFENMRRMELAGASGLLPGRQGDDPDSFKVRRGRAGGFEHYLDEADVRYMNRLINRQLNGVFGYGPHPD